MLPSEPSDGDGDVGISFGETAIWPDDETEFEYMYLKAVLSRVPLRSAGREGGRESDEMEAEAEANTKLDVR